MSYSSSSEEVYPSLGDPYHPLSFENILNHPGLYLGQSSLHPGSETDPAASYFNSILQQYEASTLSSKDIHSPSAPMNPNYDGDAYPIPYSDLSLDSQATFTPNSNHVYSPSWNNEVSYADPFALAMDPYLQQSIQEAVAAMAPESFSPTNNSQPSNNLFILDAPQATLQDLGHAPSTAGQDPTSYHENASIIDGCYRTSYLDSPATSPLSPIFAEGPQNPVSCVDPQHLSADLWNLAREQSQISDTGSVNPSEALVSLPSTPPSPSTLSIYSVDSVDTNTSAETPSLLSDDGSSTRSEYQDSSTSADQDQDYAPQTTIDKTHAIKKRTRATLRKTHPNSFASTVHSNSHKQSRRKRSGQLNCPHCNHIQRNNRRPDLKRHIRSRHLGDGIFICRGKQIGTDSDGAKIYQGGCLKAYRRSDSLGRHLRNTKSGCIRPAVVHLNEVGISEQLSKQYLVELQRYHKPGIHSLTRIRTCESESGKRSFIFHEDVPTQFIKDV